MAFDLSTAKPVTAAPAKFDLSTAKPVEESAAPEQPSMLRRAGKFYADYLTPASVVEPAAALATNMITTPIAGLAGMATGATNALGLTDTPAADVVNKVAGSAYQPKTPGGKLGNDLLSYPFKKLAEGADWVGDKINQPGVLIPTPIGTFQGGAGPAAAVNTAIQSIPAILMRGRGRAKPAEVARETAETPTAEAKTPNTIAKEYVAKSTNLDWDSLSATIKGRLTDIAKQSGDLSGIDPKALERQAQLSSLRVPVPGTRGMLTRDPVQLRNEGNISATTTGKPIRDIHVAANKALLDNLEVLKGRTRGSANSPEQVGTSVQDAARGKAAASKANYNNLYKQARATEPDAAVNSAPLQNMLERNPEMQHLGFLNGWLKKAGIDGPTKQVKLSELQDLREKAGGIARAGGTDGYYAGQVVGAIDEAMKQVPSAAKAWKQAQQAFKAHKMEFEEQGGVNKLVDDKSRTDRAVALEDTWRKTVIGGSIEDLRKVKRSLLTGGDTTTRAAGKIAWRDMRAQTIQHITEEATKSVARFEDGLPNITPASMERALKSVGKDKLEEIFGPGTVKEINKIMEATRIVKTEPPAIHKGASTAANVMALLESKLDKIPVIGSTVAGTVKAVNTLKGIGENSRVVRSAQTAPLDDVQIAKSQPIDPMRAKIAALLAAQASGKSP